MSERERYLLRQDIDRLRKDVEHIDNANIYEMSSNVPIMVVTGDTYSPTSVTFTSYRLSGKSKKFYDCKLIIYESTNGEDWIFGEEKDNAHIISYEPKLSGAKFLKGVQIDGSNQLDSQTVAIIDSEDLDSGYTIILGNEAHSISCNSNGTVAGNQTIEIPIYVYKGVNRVDSYLKPLTTPPGVTATIVQCSSSNPGKVTLNIPSNIPLSTKTSGIIDFIFDLPDMDRPIEKQFSWSKAIQGASGNKGDTGLKGSDGDDGEDGEGFELVFRRSSENEPIWSFSAPLCPNPQRPQCIPPNWTDKQSGVSKEYPFEFVSRRTYAEEEGVVGGEKKWSNYSVPKIWASYSMDGEKGEGITDSELKEKLDELGDINASLLGGVPKEEFLQRTLDVQTINGLNNATITIMKLGFFVFIKIYGWNTTIVDLVNYHNLTGNPTASDDRRPNKIEYALNVTGGRVSITPTGVIRYSNANGTVGANYTVYADLFYISKPNMKTVLFQVINPTLMAEDVYMEYGSEISILLREQGSLDRLANKPVSIVINGTRYMTTTNSNGTAYKKIFLNKGNMSFSASFPGDSEYNQYNTGNYPVVQIRGATLYTNSMNIITVPQGQEALFKPLRSSSGGTIPRINIRITINGRDYDRVTDDDGIARLRVNLAKGNYTYTYALDPNKIEGNNTGSGTITVT